jgi:hypothetical protein
MPHFLSHIDGKGKGDEGYAGKVSFCWIRAKNCGDILRE